MKRRSDSIFGTRRPRRSGRSSSLWEGFSPLHSFEAPSGAFIIPPAERAVADLPLEVKDDGESRGLHFFCLNSDIGRQFEFVQETWSNNPRFNGLYDNKDPIIGDNDGSSHMALPGRAIRRRLMNLPRFVTMRGGAYFFVPSLRSLQFLANFHRST